MADESGGKKGLHPMAWVGIGCGGLLLISLVGLSLLVGMCQRKVSKLAHDPEAGAAMAAEMVIRANPELELLSSDREAGTVTFRDKKSGKETTVTYEDVAQGKIRVETDEGTTTIGGEGGGIRTETAEGVATMGIGGIEKLPKWFEVPPGITGWQSLIHQERGGKLNGMIRGEAAVEPAAIIDAFARNLEAAGFERQTRSEVGATVSINYEKAGPVRHLIAVSAFPQEGKTFVQVTYDER